jgi:hypothetical protein
MLFETLFLGWDLQNLLRTSYDHYLCSGALSQKWSRLLSQFFINLMHHKLKNDRKFIVRCFANAGTGFLVNEMQFFSQLQFWLTFFFHRQISRLSKTFFFYRKIDDFLRHFSGFVVTLENDILNRNKSLIFFLFQMF